MNNEIISRSPFGKEYRSLSDEPQEVSRLVDFVSDWEGKVVAIQGLGFVGSAMAAAVASARDSEDGPLYKVIGVDLNDAVNAWKIGRTNEGRPPVRTTDSRMEDAFREANKAGNLIATYSEHAYALADVVVVDIHLDIHKEQLGHSRDYSFNYESFKDALQIVADNVQEDTLVLIETTVPPGTTEKVAQPIFEKSFVERGLDPNKVRLAHSYERVMPGPNYLDSIINYYRAFAGIDPESSYRARDFLSSFINTSDFPLSELHNPRSSEMAKVLENSYRAMNIAFIKEWAEFSQNADVDLFQVLEAIRVRKTHSNIMSPGFGVGGYCLTKDSLLADWSYRCLFGSGDHLEMSLDAIEINDFMPRMTLDLVQKYYGDLTNKRMVLLGISYLNDVADTRYSPSEYFVTLAEQEEALVVAHDPLVKVWDDKDVPVENDLTHSIYRDAEVVVVAVRHQDYLSLDAKDYRMLFPNMRLLVDANDVVEDRKARQLTEDGITVLGLGKGHWKKWNRCHE